MYVIYTLGDYVGGMCAYVLTCYECARYTVPAPIRTCSFLPKNSHSDDRTQCYQLARRGAPYSEGAKRRGAKRRKGAEVWKKGFCLFSPT